MLRFSVRDHIKNCTYIFNSYVSDINNLIKLLQILYEIEKQNECLCQLSKDYKRAIGAETKREKKKNSAEIQKEKVQNEKVQNENEQKENEQTEKVYTKQKRGNVTVCQNDHIKTKKKKNKTVIYSENEKVLTLLLLIEFIEQVENYKPPIISYRLYCKFLYTLRKYRHDILKKKNIIRQILSNINKECMALLSSVETLYITLITHQFPTEKLKMIKNEDILIKETEKPVEAIKKESTKKEKAEKKEKTEKDTKENNITDEGKNGEKEKKEYEIEKLETETERERETERETETETEQIDSEAKPTEKDGIKKKCPQTIEDVYNEILLVMKIKVEAALNYIFNFCKKYTILINTVIHKIIVILNNQNEKWIQHLKSKIKFIKQTAEKKEKEEEEEEEKKKRVVTVAVTQKNVKKKVEGNMEKGVIKMQRELVIMKPEEEVIIDKVEIKDKQKVLYNIRKEKKNDLNNQMKKPYEKEEEDEESKTEQREHIEKTEHIAVRREEHTTDMSEKHYKELEKIYKSNQNFSLFSIIDMIFGQIGKALVDKNDELKETSNTCTVDDIRTNTKQGYTNGSPETSEKEKKKETKWNEKYPVQHYVKCKSQEKSAEDSNNLDVINGVIIRKDNLQNRKNIVRDVVSLSKLLAMYKQFYKKKFKQKQRRLQKLTGYLQIKKDISAVPFFITSILKCYTNLCSLSNFNYNSLKLSLLNMDSTSEKNKHRLENQFLLLCKIQKENLVNSLIEHSHDLMNIYTILNKNNHFLSFISVLSSSLGLDGEKNTSYFIKENIIEKKVVKSPSCKRQKELFKWRDHMDITTAFYTPLISNTYYETQFDLKDIFLLPFDLVLKKFIPKKLVASNAKHESLFVKENKIYSRYSFTTFAKCKEPILPSLIKTLRRNKGEKTQHVIIAVLKKIKQKNLRSHLQHPNLNYSNSENSGRNKSLEFNVTNVEPAEQLENRFPFSTFQPNNFEEEKNEEKQENKKEDNNGSGQTTLEKICNKSDNIYAYTFTLSDASENKIEKEKLENDEFSMEGNESSISFSSTQSVKSEVHCFNLLESFRRSKKSHKGVKRIKLKKKVENPFKINRFVLRRKASKEMHHWRLHSPAEGKQETKRKIKKEKQKGEIKEEKEEEEEENEEEEKEEEENEKISDSSFFGNLSSLDGRREIINKKSIQEEYIKKKVSPQKKQKEDINWDKKKKNDSKEEKKQFSKQENQIFTKKGKLMENKQLKDKKMSKCISDSEYNNNGSNSTTATSTAITTSESVKKTEFQKIVNSCIKSFNCALSKKNLIQGKMYLTHKHIYFISLFNMLFSNNDFLKIKFKDITNVEKITFLLFIPNSIKIQTTNDSYLFTSFVHREEAFIVIKELIHVNKIYKIPLRAELLNGDDGTDTEEEESITNNETFEKEYWQQKNKESDTLSKDIETETATATATQLKKGHTNNCRNKTKEDPSYVTTNESMTWQGKNESKKKTGNLWRQDKKKKCKYLLQKYKKIDHIKKGEEQGKSEEAEKEDDEEEEITNVEGEEGEVENKEGEEINIGVKKRKRGHSTSKYLQLLDEKGEEEEEEEEEEENKNKNVREKEKIIPCVHQENIFKKKEMNQQESLDNLQIKDISTQILLQMSQEEEKILQGNNYIPCNNYISGIIINKNFQSVFQSVFSNFEKENEENNPLIRSKLDKDAKNYYLEALQNIQHTFRNIPFFSCELNYNLSLLENGKKNFLLPARSDMKEILKFFFFKNSITIQLTNFLISSVPATDCFCTVLTIHLHKLTEKESSTNEKQTEKTQIDFAYDISFMKRTIFKKKIESNGLKQLKCSAEKLKQYVIEALQKEYKQTLTNTDDKKFLNSNEIQNNSKMSSTFLKSKSDLFKSYCDKMCQTDDKHSLLSQYEIVLHVHHIAKLG